MTRPALLAAEVFGERLALEAAHAVADADPVGRSWIDRSDWGSVTPISLYRRRLADEQPTQVLRTARRIVSLPLLELPSVDDLRARARGATGRPRRCAPSAARHAPR